MIRRTGKGYWLSPLLEFLGFRSTGKKPPEFAWSPMYIIMWSIKHALETLFNGCKLWWFGYVQFFQWINRLLRIIKFTLKYRNQLCLIKEKNWAKWSFYVSCMPLYLCGYIYVCVFSVHSGMLELLWFMIIIESTSNWIIFDHVHVFWQSFMYRQYFIILCLYLKLREKVKQIKPLNP